MGRERLWGTVGDKEEAQRRCSLLDCISVPPSLFTLCSQAYCPSPSSCSHLPTSLGAWALSKVLLASIWPWTASYSWDLESGWHFSQVGLAQPKDRDIRQASILPQTSQLLLPSDLRAKTTYIFFITTESQQYPDIQVIKPGAIRCYPSSHEMAYLFTYLSWQYIKTKDTLLLFEHDEISSSYPSISQLGYWFPHSGSQIHYLHNTDTREGDAIGIKDILGSFQWSIKRRRPYSYEVVTNIEFDCKCLNHSSTSR